MLEYGDYRKELYGGELNTTNNRMEMTALLEALNALKKEGLVIEVFSDSSYLMNCFRQKWYENWQKNGWQTAAKSLLKIKTCGKSSSYILRTINRFLFTG